MPFEFDKISMLALHFDFHWKSLVFDRKRSAKMTQDRLKTAPRWSLRELCMLLNFVFDFASLRAPLALSFWSHLAPKTTPKWIPKQITNRLAAKCLRRSPPDRPKSVEDGPRTPKSDPRPSGHLRTPKDTPSRCPIRPKTSQEDPRHLREAPKTAIEPAPRDPKTVQHSISRPYCRTHVPCFTYICLAPRLLSW